MNWTEKPGWDSPIFDIRLFELAGTPVTVATLVFLFSLGHFSCLVKKTLEEIARELPWRQAGKEPIVLLTEFGDSCVNFEVSVWMEDPWSVRRARSDVNERIWWALKDSGVTIAFPQLDVHFDPPVVDSLKGLARAS